ncbi:MAG: flagellin [Lachnospira eligens]
MEGLTKQRDFAKSKMKDAFEAGIGQMQGYQEQVSNAKADVGNRQIRLDLTKTRLTEQKTNFTDLKSQNEDIDLEEIVVTYTSSYSLYIRQHYQLRARLFSRHCLIFLGSQHKQYAKLMKK